jgi:hypothetical protein
MRRSRRAGQGDAKEKHVIANFRSRRVVGPHCLCVGLFVAVEKQAVER